MYQKISLLILVIATLACGDSATRQVAIQATNTEQAELEAPTIAPTEVPPADTPTPTLDIPDYRLLNVDPPDFYVLVDKEIGSDKDTLRDIVNIICEGETFCYVFFWDDEGKAATSLPMTDAQVNAQVAVYDLNTSSGLDRLMICTSGSCEE